LQQNVELLNVPLRLIVLHVVTLWPVSQQISVPGVHGVWSGEMQAATHVPLVQVGVEPEQHVVVE
jgi:hypothetical protein